MKKHLIYLLGITLFFVQITSVSAFRVALLLSNHTNLKVHSQGTITYEEKTGEMLWSQPLEPASRTTPPHTDNVPQDKLDRDYTRYNLEYFDILDENNKLLANCMSDYYSTSNDTTIRFDLYAYEGKKGAYYCHRTVTHG